jgi:outer membrane murein-binding lipoprotein Lpp
VPLHMKLQILNALILGMLLLAVVMPQAASAQSESSTIANLQMRVAQLENRVTSHAADGVAVFVAGAFCALWAQNTGRSAWAWFFLGMLFNVVTLLVLLYKNSNDKRLRGQGT